MDEEEGADPAAGGKGRGRGTGAGGRGGGGGGGREGEQGEEEAPLPAHPLPPSTPPGDDGRPCLPGDDVGGGAAVHGVVRKQGGREGGAEGGRGVIIITIYWLRCSWYQAESR